MVRADGGLVGTIYRHEATFIQAFQSTFSSAGPLLAGVSQIGDPSMAFIFYFPLIFAINKIKGIRFIATFIFSECLNQVLKWVLQGDRPYWWVKENGEDILLEQTFLTCETGPGLPSGHCQASFVVWYCLLDSLAQPRSRHLVFVVVFVPLQILMMASRIFIAAHFPHQCISGFLIGALCVQLIYKNEGYLTHATKRKVLYSAALPAVATATFATLVYSGFNPNWSVALARKWCRESTWIYLDTTPFYAMTRYSGSALGLAAAGNLKFLNYEQRGLSLVSGLCSGMFTNTVHKIIPRHNIQVFYFLECIINFSNVILVILLPYIIIKLWSLKLELSGHVR